MFVCGLFKSLSLCVCTVPLINYKPNTDTEFEFYRETILRIKELGFAFAGQPPLFSQIDFTVGPTTRMVVLGKNGCGAGGALL